MPLLEFPNGAHIDFETIEGLFSALEHIRDRKPIIIRSEKDGVRQVLWAPRGRPLIPQLIPQPFKPPSGRAHVARRVLDKWRAVSRCSLTRW